MPSQFRPDYKGIGEMLCSPAMQAAMHVLAERIADRARAIAPFDPNDPDGQHYKDAFEVSSGVREETPTRTRRAYGRVANADKAALAVEYGNRTHHPHRTLGRALDAVKE